MGALGIILLLVLAAGLVTATIGWILARTRPAPEVIRDDLGPIVQSYRVPPQHLHGALEQTLAAMRGTNIARRDSDALIISVRPSAARLDDGMGLFVRLRLQPAGAATRYILTGMCRSAVGDINTSQRALVSFDRDLRMTMQRTTGMAAVMESVNW